MAPHFAARFSGETMILYDRTHKEAFFHQNHRWTILPVEEFSLGPGTAEERGWRELWRRYFKTLTIEERYNPKCQSTHLPKRYRHVMTEFMTEPAPAVPSPAIAENLSEPLDKIRIF